MNKRKRKALIMMIITAVIVAAITVISSCSKQNAQKVDSAFKEAKAEEEDLKREIGTVIEVNSDSIIIENTKNEKYTSAAASYPDFKKGDRVMVAYTEREENPDGTYHVTPRLLDHMNVQPEKAGD